MASDTSLRQVPLLTLLRVDWPPCCRCCVRVGTLVAFFVACICYIWSCAETMTEKISREDSKSDTNWVAPVCCSHINEMTSSLIRNTGMLTKPYTDIPLTGAHWLPCVGLHLEDDGAWQGSQETHLNLSIMEYISPPSWTHMLVSSIYAKFYYL